MRTKLCFLILILIFSAAAISAQKGAAVNSAETLLIEKEQKAWQNLAKGNAEEFGKNLAEDYEGVNGTTTHNKKQEVFAVKSTSFDKVSLADVRVKWLSEDVAVVLSIYTITISNGNKKVNYRGQSSTVYAKRDNVWLCIFHTDEPIDDADNSNQITAELQ